MKHSPLIALSLSLIACRMASQQPVQTAAPAVWAVEPAVSSDTAPAVSSVVEPREVPTADTPVDADGVALQAPSHAFQQVDVLKRQVGRDAIARRNANLSPSACIRELRSNKYPFKRVAAFKGIATPVRVDGEIEGVKFRVPGNQSKFGVLDCRLALTLVDFARFLHSAGVVQVTVDNFYRPNARLPSKRSKRSQHAYGLAIDLTSFTMADGRVLHVENDWGAGIETEPCGPLAAVLSPTANTVALRALVCNLAAAQIFHHHLTPSHDLAHRNHLHLDVKRDEASVTVR